MVNPHTIRLIDCTLRDGGYYTGWNFSPDLVSAYLQAIASAKIDYAELGYRGFDVPASYGPSASTTDRFLEGLSIPASLKVAAMVNSEELFGRQEAPEQAIARLFPSRAHVSLVRVATRLEEVEQLIPACRWLKEAGYTVTVNLRQASEYTQADFMPLRALAAAGVADVLYIADGMGAMLPEAVASMLRGLRQHWEGPLGMHAHDNRNQALANSLRALEEGAHWLDGTVLGMGRGAGNAPTERLAPALQERTGSAGNMQLLDALIRDHFVPLKAQYGWGSNIHYDRSAQYGIHPTYVQNLLSAGLSDIQLTAALDHLRSLPSRSYARPLLGQAMAHAAQAS